MLALPSSCTSGANANVVAMGESLCLGHVAGLRLDRYGEHAALALDGPVKRRSLQPMLHQKSAFADDGCLRRPGFDAIISPLASPVSFLLSMRRI